MEENSLNFLDHFSSLEDPRSSRNQLYALSEILLATLCAVICGAEGWQDIEDYGKTKIDFLRQYLPFEHGIPSDDTFRRFFRALDPKAFQSCFVQWVRSFSEDIAAHIAIDGKTARRSFDHDKSALHMVSAFASEARIVLGQQKVSQKSNEITAIPELLKLLDITGAIVTIDAMGCQHTIADEIIERKGDYVLALKGNQGSLHDDVKTLFALPDGVSFQKAQHVDGGHGRIETRDCDVTTDVAWLHERHPKWRSIQSLIKISSTRETKGRTSTEERYYVSSLDISAAKFLKVIRSHWAIENSLHWVLDMSFGEDQSRIRKGNAPEIIGTFRHVALNLLQKYKPKRQSIKRLRKVAGWDNTTLTAILKQKIS